MKWQIVAASMLIVSILPKTVLSETLYVNSDGTHVQSTTLTSGKEYAVEASGTCYYKLPYSNLADADWDQDPYVPNSTDWNAERYNLQIVDHSVAWLGTTDGITFQPHTFSPSHVYRYYVTGMDQPLDFYFADVGYSDNSGFLTVTITEVPEPSTIILFAIGAISLLAYTRSRRK